MHSTIQRYAPSGAFGPLTLVYALGSLLAASLLAGLYMLLLDLIPFIYVSFLLTAGFGFGLAMLCSMSITAGHCRNRALALGLGLLVGATGLAASYGWGFVLALREAASTDPDVTVLQLAQEIPIGRWIDARLQGGWTVRSMEITGIGVMVIWFIEAVIVLGAPLLLAMNAAAEPYCEPCQAWTKSQGNSLKGLTRQDVQPVLDRGDLASLLTLADHPDTDSAYRIQLLRQYCPQCANTAFLTVNEIHTVIKDGKTEENKVALLENAVLTQKLSTQYLERFIQPQPEAAPVSSAPAA
ncbi:hypothetical protein ATI61_103182 [Archangium gephyra]|uniref:Uncharacterized protein n=1 Tax=Archangium gephyra TaxID=48 RepID=A0AAC8Q5G0_9BACT|nr:hypothetical protein [Archangium gephyra]AKJ01474.1 Hypothetical protein AA314_03100 [Archangium gephyra]REG34289.1 hypothetical protein ATI61_103182 [Archangium gephyra]